VSRAPLVFRATRLHARSKPKDWAWAQEHRDLIATHWRTRTADRPKLFDGRVLLVSGHEAEGDAVRVRFFETDFSAFIAWRDLGYPDPLIANGFAMGALRGSDGAFVCGVMAGHTANAGRVYFPAGTPDRSDLRPDGSVDLAASLLRELKEETALPPESYTVADHWIVVRHWPTLAFLRPVAFAEPADAVAARIRANIACQKEPELADVWVIRGVDDVDEARMPAFLQTFFRQAFEASKA
jgi:8-oxo-dGTP pyrophosphatase MutT (NUDIX family)